MHAVTMALLLSVAQQTLEAAGGKVAILENEASTLNFDFNDTKLSAIFVTSPPLKAARWMQFDGSVSLAARKGTRDIFARGTLTPEFSAASRASLIVERSGAGYHAFFVAPSINIAPRKIVEVTDPSTALMERRSETGRALGLAAGYNLAFTEDAILGLAGSFQRQWNVPDATETRRVCVTELSGVDAQQRPVTVSDCDDRYVGAVLDKRNTGQARLDFTTKIIKPASGPTLGILVASSASFAEGAATRYGVAFGPVLHPFAKPSTIVGALLVELADVTNELAKGFSDRFFVRLYAGVPFDVFK